MGTSPLPLSLMAMCNDSGRLQILVERGGKVYELLKDGTLRSIEEIRKLMTITVEEYNQLVQCLKDFEAKYKNEIR